VTEISGVDQITIEVESALITADRILLAGVAIRAVILILKISNHNLEEEFRTYLSNRIYQINGESRTHSLKAFSNNTNRINFNRTINRTTEEDIVVVGAIITRDQIFIRIKVATKIKEAEKVVDATEVTTTGVSKTGNKKTITFSSKTK
jgi:hypothetical protein